MFLVIEVPGTITDAAELSARTAREVCRADTLCDLANTLDGIEVAAVKARHADFGRTDPGRTDPGRTDPGRPEVAAPHMVAFRRGLDDLARAAGLESWQDPDNEDEDDTPLAPPEPAAG